jgi:hypothetical protein
MQTPFIVVVETEIGTVTPKPGQRGDSPRVAAFKLIGNHGMPGTYRFPAEGGGECRVHVTYTDPAGGLVATDKPATAALDKWATQTPVPEGRNNG